MLHILLLKLSTDGIFTLVICAATNSNS